MAERVHCDGCGRVGVRKHVKHVRLVIIDGSDESWRDETVSGDVCALCIETMRTRHFGQTPTLQARDEEAELLRALELPNFMHQVPADAVVAE